MDDQSILIVVAVIFILSLAGAFVLFKFLKSFASISRAGHQAGGAIAGFLLIYGALYLSFEKLLETSQGWKPVPWTISGNVEREGATTHENTTIRHLPPRPQTLTDKSGVFLLENVQVIPGKGLPEIYIESDGYYPRKYPIETSNAIIEADAKKIRLKDTIQMTKIAE